MINYYGHHKSASQWISAILYDIAEQKKLTTIKVTNNQEFINSSNVINKSQVLIFSNAEYSLVKTLLKNYVGFHIIRDPRDIIVSAYYSHKYSHPTTNWPELVSQRNYLNKTTVEDGIISEIVFLKTAILKIYNWNYDDSQIITLKMEDLIKEPDLHFSSIYKFISDKNDKELPFSLEEFLSTIKKYSFSSLSNGRKAGEEDVQHHFRKGTPGDWKTHFTDKVHDKFNMVFPDILSKLNYK
jgi:hypothetical protein